MSEIENIAMLEIYQFGSERDEKELEYNFPYLSQPGKIPTITNSQCEISVNSGEFEIDNFFDYFFTVAPLIVFEENPAYYDLYDTLQRIPIIRII